MRVAWLADPGNADGSIGGAEMTQQEFRDAAPEGVETVTVSPDEVLTTIGQASRSLLERRRSAWVTEADVVAARERHKRVLLPAPSRAVPVAKR
jgi:hypothetical protein